jgi:hypothetical protein
MARSDSDGEAAAALLTDWMRQLLAGARHRPITAEDLVFRDLHALVAGHPDTADPLAVVTDEIGRYGAASDDTVRALSSTVDRVARTDEAFALPLAELVRILRPLLDAESRHQRRRDTDDLPRTGQEDSGWMASPPPPDNFDTFDDFDDFGPSVTVPPVIGDGNVPPTTPPENHPPPDEELIRPYFTARGQVREPAPAAVVPVTIYLSDAAGSERVEAAVELLLASAGVEVTGRDDPVHGSWFRRMRGRFAGSPAAQDLAATAMHAVESQLVHAQDATITANLMQNLGPTIAALQDYDEAVIRAGALLIVKVGPRLTVHQLTPAQQFRLDHQPELARSPYQVLTALEPAEPAVPSEDWLA